MEGGEERREEGEEKRERGEVKNDGGGVRNDGGGRTFPSAAGQGDDKKKVEEKAVEEKPDVLEDLLKADEKKSAEQKAEKAGGTED